MLVVMVLFILILVAISSIVSVRGLRECWDHSDIVGDIQNALESLKNENRMLNKNNQSQNKQLEYDEYGDYYGSMHRNRVKTINAKCISEKHIDSEGEKMVTDTSVTLHNSQKNLHSDSSVTMCQKEMIIPSEEITEVAKSYPDPESQEYETVKKIPCEMFDQPELGEEKDDGSISMSDIFTFVRSERNSSRARYLRYNVETHSFDFINDPEDEYIIYEDNIVVPNWSGRTRISSLNSDAFEWSGEIDFVDASNRIIPCEIDDMCHVTKKGLIF